jgi:hypothetical protein
VGEVLDSRKSKLYRTCTLTYILNEIYYSTQERTRKDRVQEHEHVVNTTGTHHVWLGHIMSRLWSVCEYSLTFKNVELGSMATWLMSCMSTHGFCGNHKCLWVLYIFWLWCIKYKYNYHSRSPQMASKRCVTIPDWSQGFQGHFEPVGSVKIQSSTHELENSFSTIQTWICGDLLAMSAQTHE